MSSSKETNRFQIYIYIIRQKINSKWKQLSNIYSRILIYYLWTVIGINSLLTINLTINFLLFMEIRLFDQNIF